MRMIAGPILRVYASALRDRQTFSRRDFENDVRTYSFGQKSPAAHRASASLCLPKTATRTIIKTGLATKGCTCRIARGSAVMCASGEMFFHRSQ
jgi:hypothetical protein